MEINCKKKVSQDDVIWAYKLFLDREPENQAVVDAKVNNLADLAELRKEIMASNEFKLKNRGNTFLSMSGKEPPMEIEEVSEIDSIFSHVQETWNHLGNTDPYWSVLTHDEFKQNSEEEIPDQFYLSGRDDVAILVNSLERNGIDYRRLKTCLEIGCGTGRVTRWLADYFDQVFGCDISQSHLNLASRYMDKVGITNVSFRHIKTPKEFYNLPEVDVVYSIMVLQHNPPPLMALIIREMLKSLLPGGIAFFQVPTYRLEYKFSLDKYLLDNDAKLELEMHILPQYKIFEIAAKENEDIIEVLEDGYVGLAYGARSNIFIIRKKRALF